MSQLLAEALHDVQRVAEIAAAKTAFVVQHPPGFDLSGVDQTPALANSNSSLPNGQNLTDHRRLFGALGQSKSWFMPALNSALNTSLSRKPREQAAISPPWAPASLFLSFEAVQKMIHPLLPDFNVTGSATIVANGTQSNETHANWMPPWKWRPNSTLTPRLRCGHCNHSYAVAPIHLHVARRRHAPPLLLRRRLLTMDSLERLSMSSGARRSLTPNWTASAAEIWSSPHFLNSPFLHNHSYNNTQQTWICGADFAKRLEASTALGCADALALVLACTALLMCVVTLSCVWMLTRRLRQPPDAPEKMGDELSRPPALMTASLVDGETPVGSPESVQSPLQRLMSMVPRPDRKFSALC